jgi:8-oxo-dGTP pyrophosphatase MutT (NUDIX family)
MRADFDLAHWPARIADEGLDALRPHLLADAPEAPTKPTRSDYDLTPENRPQGPRKLRPAAVLMPIVQRAEPTMLFTRRTPHLARHAGQVSFPGGRVSEDDDSLIETALRETEEETGITADFVSVAGFLETYETGTGFAIVPVVGMLKEGFRLMPDPGEVDEVFEVPLSFLLDPANRERKSAEWQGRRREFYAYNYGPHYIWGATAAILVGFMERLVA